MQANTNPPKVGNKGFSYPVPLWLVLLLLLTCSAIIVYLFQQGNKPHKELSDENSKSVIAANPQYSFLNPNLDNINTKFVKPFREEVVEYIEKVKKEGKATSISVYFRGLNDGYTFGINDRENYHPASLLKVPVLIAYLKMAEDTPSLLDREFVFDKKINDIPNNVPNHIEFGKSYKVRDLLKQMIIYSDNDASFILDMHLPEVNRKQVYKDFSLNIPEGPATMDMDYLCLADYVRFFRILYNASYLNKDMSQMVLQMLTEVYFKDGIVLGVGDTKVAHKYGEWSSNGLNQLHDCGIVYYGSRPYLIGVMTRGKDVYTLAQVIQNISNIAFDNMQK